MSLSRKHFEAIAREIKTLMGADLRWTDEPFSNFIDSLCYNFRQDNPNFDRDKFIKHADSRTAYILRRIIQT
jgi:hypothetical protein